MRIVHFIATNFVGGPEKQIFAHLSRLKHTSHTPSLISFDEPGGHALRNEAHKLGLECELLPARTWAIYGAYRRYTNYITKYGG